MQLSSRAEVAETCGDVGSEAQLLCLILCVSILSCSDSLVFTFMAHQMNVETLTFFPIYLLLKALNAPASSGIKNCCEMFIPTTISFGMPELITRASPTQNIKHINFFKMEHILCSMLFYLKRSKLKFLLKIKANKI